MAPSEESALPVVHGGAWRSRICGGGGGVGGVLSVVRVVVWLRWM